MSNIGQALIISFFWALWPILAQRYGQGHYLYTLICIGCTLTVATVQTINYKPSSEPTSIMMLLFSVGLGVINGIAMVRYPGLLGNVTNPSTWVAIVTALICVLAVLIDSVITRSITSKQIFGLCLVVTGIIIMMRDK